MENLYYHIIATITATAAITFTFFSGVLVFVYRMYLKQVREDAVDIKRALLFMIPYTIYLWAVFVYMLGH